MLRSYKKHRAFGASLISILLGIAAADGVYGQVDTGTLLGTVQDQSGSVVPGATVTLLDEGTGFTATTKTGKDGGYIFTPVKIGSYTVEAEFQGFQKVVRRHIPLNIQQQVVADFVLVPGAITQSVEVIAAPPLLQTANGSVGQVVGQQEINTLPLNGRNFTMLARLSAGVSTGSQDNRGLGATGSFSANGLRPAQNNYLLDGMDNNSTIQDFQNGAAYVVLPPVDAISEFKVQTSAFSAEFGRAGGAVLNATTRSGTNKFHGNVWEFLRNDRLDAADFFENTGNIKKGKFRRNQYGFTLGGPVVIPHFYKGKNKTFLFGDWQGTRIRQGVPLTTTVPTLMERNSEYTDFSDLITGQSGRTPADLLARTFPLGTIFDPATTRPVTQGQADPVTGLAATGTGFVRDPFQGNRIDLGRLDPNAIRLVRLYPSPGGSGLFNNFTTNPVLRNNLSSFDARGDENFSDHDTAFVRVSWSNNTLVPPSPFPGVADGQFATPTARAGTLIARARNAALSETHTFSPSLVNEARVGFSWLHARLVQPFADMVGLPEQFGIKGVPQTPLNGGLPTLEIGGLTRLGSNTFLPNNKYSFTGQITDNVSKISGAHTFKAGFELQLIKSTLTAPPNSRGQFSFDGVYTSIPNVNVGSTGRAQFLLIPIPATVSPGIDFVGGANRVAASNMSNQDYRKSYTGIYLQDDWKLTPKLTFNLGLRWEYFSLPTEHYGAAANFQPRPPGSAMYLVPQRRCHDPISQSFSSLFAKDGISLVCTDNRGLGRSERDNVAPRFGFAYQAAPKWVLRGGYGIFYSAFENIGGLTNGRNYPFFFQFLFPSPDPVTPVTFADGSRATLENGLLAVPFSPTFVKAGGLQLQGTEFGFRTGSAQSANLTLQYQLTPNQSISVGYVGSLVRHLINPTPSNVVTQILPPGQNPQRFVPFPDFAREASFVTTQGNSYYHSLQANFERRLSAGLAFLGNYTWAKCRTDARDTLNNTVGGYRAPGIPGFGIQGDYGLCDADIRQIFHLSGGYRLPFGRGRRFLPQSRGVLGQVVGGWNINWILTLQDGQPFTVPCSIATVAGLGCHALLVPGQNPIGGAHNVNQWMNAAAFADPPVATAMGQADLAPLGGAPTQLVGPGFHRLDFSLSKTFKTSETTRLELRSEFFNLTNTPNFALPTLRNFLDTKNFGRITSTRDAPDDAREIQLALKFHW